MNQRIERDLKHWLTRKGWREPSLPGFVHRSLAVFVSVLFLSESVAATPGRYPVKIAQQPEATLQDGNRTAAERAYAEGQQLFEQGTASSRRQAIEKYSEALQLWRTVGDRSQEALTLQGIGLVYYTLGENQKTLDYYNSALPLYRAVGDRSGEAIMLTSIGGVYSDLGEKQKALNSFNSALPLFRALGNRSLEALTLNSIGKVYSDLGEKQKALDSYNSALVLQRGSGDRAGVADTLQTIGVLYLSLGESQKALDSFNQALPLLRAVGNRSGEALTLNTIGTVYHSLGENQKALDSYTQALPLFRAEKDRSGEASTLSGIGAVYNSLGDPQKALDSYNQALVFLRAVGNRTGEAETLNQIGIVYDELGSKQKALDSFNSALPLVRSVGNRAREAFTLNNIGGVYNSLGEKQKALDSFNSALVLQRATGDRAGEAATLTYIALVYSSLGDYQLSLESYTQALSLSRAVGDRYREAQTLYNISGVYRLSGDYHMALDFSTQALSLWRALGNRFQEAATLTTIVRVYESLGDYQKALDSSIQVLSLSRVQKNRFMEAAALALMGRAYRSLGNYQKALGSFNQALSVFRVVGSRVGEAPTLDNIGRVYDSLGEHQLALQSYNQALSLSRALGDRSGEAETLYNIAGAYRARGNLSSARTQIEAALTIIESLRTKVASQELRASYFASVQKYYEFYIDLLMQLHKQRPSAGFDGKALQASERARARSLLEILTEANADIRQGVDPQLVERERTLQQQLSATEKRQLQVLSGEHTEEQAAAIRREIQVLLGQYQEVQAQIRATSPRYAALTQPQPLTLAEIQQQVLDNDTLLLEYSLGSERSYLWAVSKTGITSYELPKRADIEAAVQRFREVLTTPRLITRPKQVAKAAVPLSQMLLEPVTEQLGQKRLLIVGDGALQYVPFTALPVPAKPEAAATPLLVEHEIVSLPSASTLAVLRREHNGRKPAAKTIAVLADPVFGTDDQRVKKTARLAQEQSDRSATPSNMPVSVQTLARSARVSGVSLERLDGTRQEAEQILKLVPASSRIQAFDFAASRAAATSPDLAQYRIVHFATHGILNSVNPELSGVVLSLVDENGTPQNGYLRLHEIFNLNLPAELVVLSACQTGLGKEVRGEGLVGLTRGFMYAGAPRVVVSLWSVDDEATALLMTKFYKGMLEKGLQPAAALRAAQIEMWKQQHLSAPYYWAAFVLQGEWN